MKQKDSSIMVSYLWNSLFFRGNHREEALSWIPTSTVLKSKEGLSMMQLPTLHTAEEKNGQQQLMYFSLPQAWGLLKGHQMHT